MSKRVEMAMNNHKKGYNCCQAVALAFADKVNVDETTLFQMTEGFGLGMGCMDGTCGAVSGAILLAGMQNSTGNLTSPNSKADTYKLSREIVQRFAKKNHSIVCKELKGVETNKVLRSCDGCIEDATRIVESLLFPEE